MQLTNYLLTSICIRSGGHRRTALMRSPVREQALFPKPFRAYWIRNADERHRVTSYRL
ncbi:hypothetical protein L083_7211 [Actinoplanes sp. N902-109]|nr:hypothetical protein L083_7211 [Actinoplanes sp. N902-109]